MAKRSRKKKPAVDAAKADRKAMFAVIGCGVFAVAFGVVEGFVFKSTATYTGTRGTFSMDPLTSILIIGGGLIGIGFGVWGLLNPRKEND